MFNPATDYELCAGTLVPNDDVSPVGGLVNPAAPIDPNALGAFLPTMRIPVAGQADLAWNYKLGARNKGSDPFLAPVWFIENGLKRVTAGQGSFSLVAGPGDTGKALLGYISASTGLWVQEIITLAGDTPVFSQGQGAQSSPAILQRVTAGSTLANATLTTAASPTWLSRGTLLGYCPQGEKQASSCYRLSIEDTKGANTQSDNRLEPPDSGASAPSEAYDLDSALAIPGVLDLEATEDIGLWLEVTAFNGMPRPLVALKPIIIAIGSA